MLNRLQAEEQLSAIQATAIGGGHLTKRDTMKALGNLRRRATGDTEKATAANPAVLAAMGIAVVETPRAQENGNG
ncbi:hypothetical protein K1W69_17520 [Hoeflea sp. WL0058]|uniref:Uncharacterized protein n=1 Tax=Flavimaribacter sediminis TaxID=2865987 RepID=A0AAE2ZQP9_9HYPH|nr:hypothetical protein [Flavimaribacter sediminis]MBW8639000.1 hypothetical protein [Flavimaribacter sediminis]